MFTPRLAPSLLALLLLSFSFCVRTALSAAGDTCSTSSQCDSSAPCCGLANTCGSGAMFCAGYCQPMASNKPTSCLPNPICQDTNITFSPNNYNDPKTFRPILQYNGDASLAPFTLDSGSLGKGSEGVVAQLTIDRQVKISTTRYVLYGEVEARLRSNVSNGLVVAFIFMSDTRDEIDWEFTTSDAALAKTNYFWQGISATGDGSDIEQPNLDRSQWNTYSLNWQPNSLQWKINGQVVRTLKRSDAGPGGNYFPRSPSRVQLSMWSGGNSTNSEGVISWAGGPTDWNSPYYKSTGYYALELGSFNVRCSDPNSHSLATTGSGANLTSWVYTGTNDSTTGNEPGFQLNKDAITYLKNPAAGGVYGTPGYEDQTAATKANSNMWDGSGDTGADDAAAGGSGGSGSGGGGGISAASAKKYGIPIAAGVVALILLWALIVGCVRRRRNKRNAVAGVQGGNSNANIGTGAARRGSAALTSGGIAGGRVTSGALGSSGGKYTQLNDPAGQSDADLPMGAEKQGHGVGPASGPRPGVRFNNPAQESYAMTPQVAGGGAGGGTAWNRVQTPAIQQYQHGSSMPGGWGSGAGYASAPGVQYHQQPYSVGGMGYTSQHQPSYPVQQQQYHQQTPAWAQSPQQQYGGQGYPHRAYPQQQQHYGTPNYYS